MKKLRGKPKCLYGVKFTVKWDYNWGMPRILADGDVIKGEQLRWMAEICRVWMDMIDGKGKFAPAWDEDEPDRSGFVYLIRNKITGMTKIGHSTQPRVREATLQSQEPCLEMLIFWPGTRKDERALHVKFADKRMRGEWFNLTQEDIDSIHRPNQCVTRNS